MYRHAGTQAQCLEPWWTRRAHRCMSGLAAGVRLSRAWRSAGGAARIGFEGMPPDHAPVSTRLNCHSATSCKGADVEVDAYSVNHGSQKSRHKPRAPEQHHQPLMVMRGGEWLRGFAHPVRRIDRDAATQRHPAGVRAWAQVRTATGGRLCVQENWVTPTSAPSCSVRCSPPMSDWRRHRVASWTARVLGTHHGPDVA